MSAAKASPKRLARLYFLLEWIGRRWGAQGEGAGRAAGTSGVGGTSGAGVARGN